MRKPLFPLAFICLALVVGCGGSGTNNGTSGGGGGSATAATLLSGKYVFSFMGVTNERTNTPAPFVMAGSFTADGSGHITAGIEDVNQNAGRSITKAQALTGSYSIGSDGRGTLTLAAGSNSHTFAFVVETNGHGQFIWFDNSSNGFGTFDLQSSTSAPSGPYAFLWDGLDANGSVVSRVGAFTMSSGSVSQGVSDLNDGGNYIQQATGGSFGAPDSNGHGTATLTYSGGSFAYSYDVISPSRVIFIETDSGGATVGEADSQTSSGFGPSNIKGNYVFSLTGSNSDGTVADAGQFTADGSSSMSGEVSDNNAALSTTEVGIASTGNFAFADTVQGVTANGRVQLQIAFPVGTESFIGYMVSPAKILFTETDTASSGQLTDGVILGQGTGPFSASSLTGNYGVQFSGADSNGFEWDFSGQIVSSGQSTLSSGTLDINEEDQTSTTFTGSTTLSGANYSVANGTTGRGILNFTNITISGVTVQMTFYFVSTPSGSTPGQLVLVETDNGALIMSGFGQNQPTIP